MLCLTGNNAGKYTRQSSLTCLGTAKTGLFNTIQEGLYSHDYMKYIFLFCSSREDQAAWEAMPPEQAAEAYGRVGKWFEDNGEKISGGYELQGPDTATTVRFGSNGDTMVTDGPFIEANEVIGGYAEVEAENLDEALRLAKAWPGGGPVEIRPVVAR